MIKNPIFRLTSALALSAALAGVGAQPAAARPDDGGDRRRPPRIVVVNAELNCPLRRLDRQLVRCDNLTGAGVPASLFIQKL
jgi:hypothetical protein